jgi:hypothetical protein
VSYEISGVSAKLSKWESQITYGLLCKQKVIPMCVSLNLKVILQIKESEYMQTNIVCLGAEVLQGLTWLTSLVWDDPQKLQKMEKCWRLGIYLSCH